LTDFSAMELIRLFDFRGLFYFWQIIIIFFFSYGVDVGDQESREDNVKFYPTATCGQVKLNDRLG
jgi:hypothetical protein